MAWYLEYDHYPFCDNRLMPERKLIGLSCPSDLKTRDRAIKEAKQLLKTYRLANPLLVWQEKIPK